MTDKEARVAEEIKGEFERINTSRYTDAETAETVAAVTAILRREYGRSVEIIGSIREAPKPGSRGNWILTIFVPGEIPEFNTAKKHRISIVEEETRRSR